MTKILHPIHDRKEYSDSILDNMLQQLWNTIFRPVFEILNLKTLARINSIADLKNALRAGRIFWQDGYFYGAFNSVTGKALRDLGASFSSQKKAYKLDINKIPMDMRTDIVIGKGMNQSKTERILKHLEETKPLKLIVGSGMQATTMFDDLNKQAITTFKVLPENLQIPMELTQQQKDNLANTYQKNLSEHLEDWKVEQIERLREKTQQNAALGYRADRLTGIIKSEFDVTRNRAKFIAWQETSQFVSKYRQDRYTNAGIKQYIWSTSKDSRVRPDHKVLDHQIFTWDMPPITNRTTGERNHPGQDFGCRCLALPVIRLGAL